MVRLGMLIFLLGAAVTAGFSVYLLVKEVLLDPDFPLALKVGLPAMGVGLLLLLAVAVRERVSMRRRDGLKEAEP
jgi:hypothetical protein